MEYGAILFGGVKWAGERALIANAQNYLLGEEFRMQKTKYNSNCVTQCVCVCVFVYVIVSIIIQAWRKNAKGYIPDS